MSQECQYCCAPLGDGRGFERHGNGFLCPWCYLTLPQFKPHTPPVHDEWDTDIEKEVKKDLTGKSESTEATEKSESYATDNSSECFFCHGTFGDNGIDFCEYCLADPVCFDCLERCKKCNVQMCRANCSVFDMESREYFCTDCFEDLNPADEVKKKKQRPNSDILRSDEKIVPKNNLVQQQKENKTINVQ